MHLAGSWLAVRAAWINALAVARVEPQDQMAAMSDLTSARQVVDRATEGLDPLSREWIEAFFTAAGLQDSAATLLAQGVVSKDHLLDLPPYETLTKTPFKLTVVAANRLARFAHAVHAESGTGGSRSMGGSHGSGGSDGSHVVAWTDPPSFPSVGGGGVEGNPPIRCMGHVCVVVCCIC